MEVELAADLAAKIPARNNSNNNNNNNEHKSSTAKARRASEPAASGGAGAAIHSLSARPSKPVRGKAKTGASRRIPLRRPSTLSRRPTTITRSHATLTRRSTLARAEALAGGGGTSSNSTPGSRSTKSRKATTFARKATRQGPKKLQRATQSHPSPRPQTGDSQSTNGSSTHNTPRTHRSRPGTGASASSNGGGGGGSGGRRQSNRRGAKIAIVRAVLPGQRSATSTNGNADAKSELALMTPEDILADHRNATSKSKLSNSHRRQFSDAQAAAAVQLSSAPLHDMEEDDEYFGWVDYGGVDQEDAELTDEDTDWAGFGMPNSPVKSTLVASTIVRSDSSGTANTIRFYDSRPSTGADAVSPLPAHAARGEASHPHTKRNTHHSRNRKANRPTLDLRDENGSFGGDKQSGNYVRNHQGQRILPGSRSKSRPPRPEAKDTDLGSVSQPPPKQKQKRRTATRCVYLVAIF